MGQVTDNKIPAKVVSTPEAYVYTTSYGQYSFSHSEPFGYSLTSSSGEKLTNGSYFFIDQEKAVTGFTLDMRGTKLVYDPAKETLTCKDVVAPAKHRENAVKLLSFVVVVDRGSVEVFGNAGSVAASVAHVAPEKDQSVTALGDGTTLDRVTWWPIKLAWK